MVLELIGINDIVKKGDRNYWKNFDSKTCSKCGTENINNGLTEIKGRSGKGQKSYLCDLCDKIK
jgi:hypothetical protein